MSYYSNYSNYVFQQHKIRHGTIPLIAKNGQGHHLVYNSRNNSFNAIDMKNMVTVVAPLVVQYIVPFVKDIIGAFSQKQQSPQQFQHYSFVPILYGYY